MPVVPHMNPFWNCMNLVSPGPPSKPHVLMPTPGRRAGGAGLRDVANVPGKRDAQNQGKEGRSRQVA